MQYQKIIEQLGYSTKEAQVYLTSLSLGEAHISDIASAIKMPRSTVQFIVNKLHDDGLMNFYVMRRYKYWVAEKPEVLLENFKKREKAIEEALPELTAIRKESRNNNKKEEELFQKSLELIKAFSETSHLPILITNSDIEIVYVNNPWQETLGYKLKEVLGENPRIFDSGQTPKGEYSAMWSSLKKGCLFQTDRIIDQCKDGRTFSLITSIFPIYHANRKFYVQVLNETDEKEKVDKLYQDFSRHAK